MVNVALLTVSILLLKHLGKMTAFATLKLNVAVLRKVGSSFLPRQIVNKSECQAVTICPPDHVYSGYLEGLSDRKGKEFGSSRANKFLRKICSAKRKVQYGGSLGRDARE